MEVNKEATAELDDTTAQAEPDKAEAEVTTPAAEDVEAEAREMGWVPQEEFKGDPDRWRPAEDFVKRGKEILPIVNKRLETANKEIETLKSKIAAHDETVRRLSKMQDTAVQRARQKAIEEFEARKEAAVETGDTEGYKAAVKAEKDALKEFETDAEAEADKAKKGKAVEPSEDGKKWLAENSWFNTDIRMRKYAVDINNHVIAVMPDATEAEQLAEVRRYVEEEFPDKFAKPKANGGSRVEGGSRGANGGAGRDSQWNALPAEAKRQGEADIASGLYKTKEEWATAYNS